jgi:PIN domain nuclease of toxin-antitoxin system
MRLLLDTHVLLWWFDNSANLGPIARKVIASPENEVWVSAASAWEMAIKVALKRLEVKEPLETSLPNDMNGNGFRPLSITHAHALAVRKLPLIHVDPFDRILVAQARLEGLVLLTSDHHLARYEVPTANAEE